MAAAKKAAKRPRKQYSEEEKAAFKDKREAELTGIAASIEEGVQSFRDSDRYKEFLSVMASFPEYSYRNCLLIAQQNPDASLVAGFNKWKEMGRHVKKGEKGLRILAPLVRKAQEKDTEDAAPREEDKGSKGTVYGFKAVSVFDVSQTDGAPLPEETIEPTQAVEHMDALMTALQAISDVPVVLADPARMDRACGNGVQGVFFRDAALRAKDMGVPGIPPGGMICVRDGMSDAMTAKVLIHEMAHSLLHGTGCEHAGDSRAVKEFDAESVAFVVSKHLGIDTEDYSFPYLNSWVEDKTPQILHSELPFIVKTAADITRRLDPQLQREILHERSQTELAPGTCRIWQVQPSERETLSEADVIPGGGTVNKSLYDLVYEGPAVEGTEMLTPDALLETVSGNPPAAFDKESRLNVVEIKDAAGNEQAWCVNGSKTVPLQSFSPEGPPRERAQVRRSAPLRQDAMTR